MRPTGAGNTASSASTSKSYQSSTSCPVLPEILPPFLQAAEAYEAARRANAEAAAGILAQNQKGRSRGVLELHGLYVEEALEALQGRIDELRQSHKVHCLSGLADGWNGTRCFVVSLCLTVIGLNAKLDGDVVLAAGQAGGGDGAGAEQPGRARQDQARRHRLPGRAGLRVSPPFHHELTQPYRALGTGPQVEGGAAGRCPLRQNARLQPGRRCLRRRGFPLRLQNRRLARLLKALVVLPKPCSFLCEFLPDVQGNLNSI